MAEIRVNATGAVKLYDNDDSHFVGLQAGSVSSNVTFTLPTADGSNGQFLKTDGSGALSFGSVSSSGAYDLNGGELVLDADADTSITADTDDQIDIRIAGADDFQFTANTFTAQSGSTIAAQALTATTVVGSGAAQFATAGIGAAKDLGVGLHIKSADSGASVDGNADELVIEGSGQSGITICSGASDKGNIFFADSGGTAQGKVIYNHSSNHLRFDTDGSEKMRIRSDGIVLINNNDTIFSEGVLQVLGKANHSATVIQVGTNGQRAIHFANQSGVEVGDIKALASSTSYNTSSDYRLKENAVAISDGITRLKTLKPYRFNFIADNDADGNPTQTVDGFFAHEVTAVPEAVSGEKDGAEMQSIDQSKLVPLLTAALKEAITKIEALEARVTTLEG